MAGELIYILPACILIVTGCIIFAYCRYMVHCCRRRCSWNRENKTGNVSRNLSNTYEEYGVNNDQKNDRRKIFSHFKLPGNASKKLSDTTSTNEYEYE